MKGVCVFLLILAAAGAQAQVVYTVQDLGTLGGSNSGATAVNNNAQVTGYSDTENDGPSQAFVSGMNGAVPLQNLGTLEGATSSGQGINVNGAVAGSSATSSGFSHGFFSGGDGSGLRDLGTLGGTVSAAYGVNGAGQVAGDSSLSDGGRHVFLSAANGGALKDLGTLPNGASSFCGIGASVNASGQVTGYSGTTNEFQAIVNHAFISDVDGGALRDLGTLGGNSSFGTALNDAGQVTGRSETTGVGQRAFRSEPNGGPLLDLGSLGGTFSVGQGINKAGTVVGYSFPRGSFDQRAFIYTTAFGMLGLNNMIPANSGWILMDARAINDGGQIVGTGTLDGTARAYLLTPVPATAKIVSITEAESAHFVLVGIGTPFRTFTVETTSDLAVAFQATASVTAGSDGVLRYEDATGGTLRRFYRFVFP